MHLATRLSTLRTATLAISNLCRGKPPRPLRAAAAGAPCSLASSSPAPSPPQCVQAIIDAGAIQPLVGLLSEPTDSYTRRAAGVRPHGRNTRAPAAAPAISSRSSATAASPPWSRCCRATIVTRPSSSWMASNTRGCVRGLAPTWPRTQGTASRTHTPCVCHAYHAAVTRLTSNQSQHVSSACSSE